MLGKRPREEAEAATEAPQVQVPALLQGEYSNKFIRVGEEWQALVPDVNATSAISEARADQLDPLSDYVPLKEAPPPLPHPSHDFSAAAAAAAKAAADAWAESHKPVPNPFTDVFGDDEGDLCCACLQKWEDERCYMCNSGEHFVPKEMMWPNHTDYVFCAEPEEYAEEKNISIKEAERISKDIVANSPNGWEY